MSLKGGSSAALEEMYLLADVEDFESFNHFEFRGLMFDASANYRSLNPKLLRMRLLASCLTPPPTCRDNKIWVKFGLKLRGETWPRWLWSDEKCVSECAANDELFVVHSLEYMLLEPHPPLDVAVIVVGGPIGERETPEDEDEEIEERAKVIFFPTYTPRWMDLDFLNRVETYYPPNVRFDVAIRVQRKTFLAHWNILSSQSPVLSAMFSSTMAERSSGSFKVEDCDPEEFQNLLVFIYSGRTSQLSRGNVMGTYYLADKYDLPELCSHCARFITENLHVDDICNIFRLAIMHCDTALFKSAMAFFCENAIDILRMRQWKRFVEEYPYEANKIYKKAIASL